MKAAQLLNQAKHLHSNQSPAILYSAPLRVQFKKRIELTWEICQILRQRAQQIELQQLMETLNNLQDVQYQDIYGCNLMLSFIPKADGSTQFQLSLTFNSEFTLEAKQNVRDQKSKGLIRITQNQEKLSVQWWKEQTFIAELILTKPNLKEKASLKAQHSFQSEIELVKQHGSNSRYSEKIMDNNQEKLGEIELYNWQGVDYKKEQWSFKDNQEKRHSQEKSNDIVKNTTQGWKKDEIGSIQWQFKDQYIKHSDHESESKEGFSNIDGNSWKSYRETYFSQGGEQRFNKEIKEGANSHTGQQWKEQWTKEVINQEQVVSHSKKESRNQDADLHWNEEWEQKELKGEVINEWCKKAGRNENEEWSEQWSTRLVEPGLKHSKCKKWAKGEYGERVTEWSDYIRAQKRDHYYKHIENGEVKEQRQQVIPIVNQI